ncbi:hypothetical protein JXB22_06240 [candidate division WOR-3 bacterium]|nr:hypothetical protein [candidate division WOR-3 bacterium]
MSHIILILVCSTSTPDSIPGSSHFQQQLYKKQIAVNGLLSVGLIATAGIYWEKGNNAYDRYQNSATTTDALHYWEQMEKYDRIRNVCALGALFFIGRTIYYYAKLMDSNRTVGSLPSLDLQYTHTGTISFGLTKRF